MNLEKLALSTNQSGIFVKSLFLFWGAIGVAIINDSSKLDSGGDYAHKEAKTVILCYSIFRYFFTIGARTCICCYEASRYDIIHSHVNNHYRLLKQKHSSPQWWSNYQAIIVSLLGKRLFSNRKGASIAQGDI